MSNRTNIVQRMVTSPQPLVSIVIPAYNCDDTIEEAVESCLCQTYPFIEVIVVNDGSTDSTVDVLAKYGGKIKLVNQTNGGLGAARNSGQHIACGEYIAWMDGDDIAHPDRIAVQASILNRYPTIVMVSSDFSSFYSNEPDFEVSSITNYYSSVNRLGGIRKIYNNSETILIRTTSENHHYQMYWGRVYKQLLWGNFVHPGTVLVRRSIINKTDGFDETLRYSSDYDLIVRLARFGEFAIVDASLLRYRRSSMQMSASGGYKMSLETIQILEKISIADPEFYQHYRPLFRQRFAESFAKASAKIGNSNRPFALRLLLESFKNKILIKATFCCLVRILVPQIIKTALKKLMGMQIKE